MTTIALTGATGMIGTALVRYALRHDVSVICFVRPGSNHISRLPESNDVIIVEADLDDLKNIDVSGLAADMFLHLGWAKTTIAGRDDVYTQLRNIEYTLDAVELSNRLGCKVFLGAGSQAECGIVDRPISADMIADPKSGYGIAKNCAAELAEIRCGQLGIDFKWVRILSCFGLYDNPNSFVSYCINTLEKGEPLNVTPCEQLWDYIYCDDAAEMIFNVAEKGVVGRVYPVGSGISAPLSSYLLTMKNVLNSDSTINFGAIPYYKNQAMYLVADNTAYFEDTHGTEIASFEKRFKEYIKTVRNN